MANYKAVNADQLDADLSAVADAIRAKIGTTESVAFPAGFVDAVNGIQNLSGMLDGTITEVVVPKHITTLREGAFRGCSSLTKITFHEGVTSIGQGSFFGCGRLEECIFPRNIKTIGEQMFYLNYNLKKVDCWLTSITGSAPFQHCQRLTALIIRSDTVCTLSNATAFNGSTTLLNGTGYIYVPRVLVNSYKSATNWSVYASQIRAIEDYPDICGVSSISFTVGGPVAGIEYQAEAGMTWEQWCESEYNTQGANLVQAGNVNAICWDSWDGFGFYAVKLNGALVDASDIIADGTAYSLEIANHSGGVN